MMRKSRSIIDVGLRKAGTSVSKGVVLRSGHPNNVAEDSESQEGAAFSARFHNEQHQKTETFPEESPYGTSDVRKSDPALPAELKYSVTTPKTVDETVRQQKERERLLNKSLSLTKGAAPTVYSANKFKASSFIRARQTSSVYPTVFDGVKGLRNRSFLSKERGYVEGPNYSATRKPVTIRPAQLRYGLQQNRREKSNPKNLSINSRLMNPRTMNNMSKNMSIQDDQVPESLLMAQTRFRTDQNNEKYPNNVSQFEEVSMGSINSFEEANKQKSYKLKQSFKDNKMSLNLASAQLSPGKQQSHPLASFKQQQTRYWEDKFYTQVSDAKGSARQLDSSQNKGISAQGAPRTIRRAPLTQKHSQAPKISTKLAEKTIDPLGAPKLQSSISPFKNTRLSFLIKNKMMVSGKLPKSFQDSAKTCKTQRIGQQSGRSPQTPVASKFEQQSLQKSRLRYNANGSIVDKSYQVKSFPRSGQPFQTNSLRENRSSKNLPTGIATNTSSIQKQHKRSMTLKTRNTIADQVGDTFQSIKEEPAEDNAKSIENKSKEERSNADRASENNFTLNSSRRHSQFQAVSFNQSLEREIKFPQTTTNAVKTSNKISDKLNTIQVQQQYGLVSEKEVLENQDNNDNKQQSTTNNYQQNKQNQLVIKTPNNRDNSYASLENNDIEQRMTKYVPKNTRNRSYLRTTRNTITQHTPKQITIPEPFTISQRYQKYQIQTSKASESNSATFVYDLKKPMKQKNAKSFTKTASNTRPTSIQKPQQPPDSTRRRVEANESHLAAGSNKPVSKQNTSELMETIQTSKSILKNQSNDRHTYTKNAEDIYKVTGTQKKSFTSKKSKMFETQINKNASERSVFSTSKTAGKQLEQAQIIKNNLEQAQQIRNNLKKGQSAYQETRSQKNVDKNSSSAGHVKICDEGAKQVPPTFGQQEKKTGNQISIDSKQQHQTTLGASGSFGKKSSQPVMTPRNDKREEITQEKKQSLFPLSADDALLHYSDNLNEFEKQEVHDYSGKIYYLGQRCQNKVKGHAIKMVPNISTTKSRQSKDRRTSISSNSNIGQQMVPSQRQIERLKLMDIHNYGYDDGNGDYKTVLKDHIGYRFEVLESLGSGSFGQALKCIDHSNGQVVAIKIIRNKKKFQYQAGMELKILLYLNQHDKHDQYNVIRVQDYMLFREHLIIAFELLSINLYDFIKNNNFVGVSQNLIRRFAIQILQALKYQHDHSLVHCDLKPENILLKQENKSGIKVIDYGSSCFMGQRIYTYIQSRFYRAPEIILGIPYTTAIDMWSFGAIVAELFTGFPLFPGESEHEQLAYIMELYGVPPENVLRLAQRKDIFFTKDFQPKLQANSRGKIRQPCSKKLEDLLRCTDTHFLDFLNRCFIWDPVKRMSALEALQHPWILQGLPENVLAHHRKMFGYKDDRTKLRKLTQTAIQGFPKDKRELTIQDILKDIQIEQEKERQEKERQMKLAKSRMESSRNQLTRQTFTTSEGVKSARREPASDILRTQKLQKTNFNNQSQKQLPIEVAQIHLAASKSMNSQFMSGPKFNTIKNKNQSPKKDRKSRKQRMENSELKLVNRLAQFKNIDPNNKVSARYGKLEMKKSKSIKVYEPTGDDSNMHFQDCSADLAQNVSIGMFAQQQQSLQNDSISRSKNINNSVAPNTTNDVQNTTNVDQKMSIESNSEDSPRAEQGVHTGQQVSQVSSQRSSDLQHSTTSHHYKPRRQKSHIYKGGPPQGSDQKQLQDVTL